MNSIWTALLILTFTSSTWGQNFPETTEKRPLAGVARLSAGNSIQAGQDAELIIDLQLREGYFAYEKKFQLRILEPEDAQRNDFKISPIVEFEDVISKKVKKGLKGLSLIHI